MFKEKNKVRDVAIVIAWQDAWIMGDGLYFKLLKKIRLTKQSYFKVGHAAIIIVNYQTGQLEYSDFGRFTTDRGKGRARTSETDPLLKIPIEAKFTESGDVENIKEIALYISSIPNITYGKGAVTLSISKNMDFEKMKIYINKIKNRGSINYGVIGLDSTNCANYVTRILYRGTTKWRKTVKLLPGLLSTASPITNVTRANYQKRIFKVQDTEVAILNFSTFDAFKTLYLNVFKSLSNNKVPAGGWADNVSKPIRKHHDVPDNAQWLGGIVEGSWVCLTEGSMIVKNEYRIQAFLADGRTKYNVIASVANAGFDPQLSYEFIYDCNRLINTIRQNEKTFYFYWKRDVSTR